MNYPLAEPELRDIITKYGSIKYTGMTQVIQHYTHTFVIFKFHYESDTTFLVCAIVHNK